MKKIVAIFLLSMLCFNWLGYRFVFAYLEQKHDQHLEVQLDENDYKESELISIKTAFSVPYSYLNKTDQFERVKGEIEVDGIKFKYVKRRFFSDSVELLCIPNMTAMKLKEAKQDYFSLANDLSDQNKKQDQGKVPAFKNLLSEYCQEIREWEAAAVIVQQSHYSSYSLFTSQYKGDTPAQPPDFI